MAIVKSFLNGLLAIPFALWECLTLLWFIFLGKAGAYRKVADVWRDRALWELAAYYAGLGMFICWPVVLCYLDKDNRKSWCLVILILASTFLAAGLLTLSRIGARRRYEWLCRDRQAYDARLFAGFLPIGMMLSVRGKGAQTVLSEVLGMLIVLLIVPASINWCLYLQDADSFFKVPATSSITMFDFCYHSIITVFTVGYGDIAPIAWESQLVASCQIVTSWMHLTYLLPLLSAIVRRPAMRWPQAGVGSHHTSTYVDSVVRQAVDKLVDTRDPSGCWRKRLSPDVVSTAFACRALRDCGAWWFFLSKQNIDAAATWCRDAVAKEQNQDIHTIVSLCLDDRADIPGTIAFDNLAANKMRAFLWIAYVISGNADSTGDAVRNITLPDEHEWQRDFGDHWATYVQVEQLLKANLCNQQDEVVRLSSLLSQKKVDSGGWYGDILLTSVCVLVLQYCDAQATAWQEAAIWLREQFDRDSPGLPLVSDLNVWHTAMTVRLLSDVGLAQQDVFDASERWLAAHVMEADGWAWSWSSEARMVCVDSTSVVIEALRERSTRDIELKRIVDKATETIRNFGSLPNLQPFQWPTFIQDEHPLDPCPIISARCLGLSVEDPWNRRNAAMSLLEKVSSGEWTSPWFHNESLTLGLVGWYASPLVEVRCPGLPALVGKLIEKTQDVTGLGAEECGAIALGLLAGLHSASDIDDAKQAINAVVQQLLSQHSKGQWKGSPTGVFGFDRSYSDDHFATVLAIRALLEYGSRL